MNPRSAVFVLGPRLAAPAGIAYPGGALPGKASHYPRGASAAEALISARWQPADAGGPPPLMHRQYHGCVRAPQRDTPVTIFTIGHSTHPIEHFIDLLRSNGITQLIDIRTIPKSRHNPQFNSDALAASLKSAGIAYVHLKQLGGLRRAHRDSINLAWRNASFRGFADYMQTPEFEAGLSRAIELAQARPTALMCAEAVPWRCHRSLVSDALTARGIRVLEIVGAATPAEHKLTPFARVEGTHVTYPGDQPSLL